MTNKVASKILEIEKDKLMSEPESNRDWELITALDIAIETLKERDDLLERAYGHVVGQGTKGVIRELDEEN